MMFLLPFIALLLPISSVVVVQASCGDDYCSCGYGEYVTGTDCSGGRCWCYCSDGVNQVIDDYGECSGLSGGAIFGIIFVFLLLIGGGGATFWWFNNRKKRRQQQEQEQQQQQQQQQHAFVESGTKAFSPAPGGGGGGAVVMDHSDTAASEDYLVVQSPPPPPPSPKTKITKTVIHPDGTKTVTTTYTHLQHDENDDQQQQKFPLPPPEKEEGSDDSDEDDNDQEEEDSNTKIIYVATGMKTSPETILGISLGEKKKKKKKCNNNNYYNHDTNTVIYLSKISNKSIFAGQGLREGMIINSINDIPVNTIQHASTILRNIQVGQIITIEAEHYYGESSLLSSEIQYGDC